MKIAICFLLVALSSGFAAGAGSGLSSCKRKMTRTEAEVLASMVILTIHKYASLQRKGSLKSEELKCLIKTALDALDLAADIKACAVGELSDEVLSRLGISEKDKNMLKNAFVTGNTGDAGLVNVDPDNLMEAVCRVVGKMITDDGHNTTAVFKKVLADKDDVLGDLKGKVTELADLLLGGILIAAGEVIEGETKVVGTAWERADGIVGGP
ncbi:uncharacterized protein RB166_007658 [Leptodactylus fuscus]|uniref:uncharacterized protein LOC142205084 n=1 Tax=Leptodactylus fuscus TaxID=238119 RepID=UPI003F4EF6B7